jgi:hypothetical protein
MKKQYKYTLYKQDGTIVDLGTSRKKTFEEMYKILNCNLIEIIPHDYAVFKGYYELYGDEEARYNENNHRNPHFKVLIDVLNQPWDIVGDVIKEEVYHDR